jgi:hypothetical protein
MAADRWGTPRLSWALGRPEVEANLDSLGIR